MLLENENENVNDSQVQSSSDDPGKGEDKLGAVSYTSYKKLLTQHKNLNLRLKEIQDENLTFKNLEEEQQRKKLEDEGQYKALVEQVQKEKEDMKNKLELVLQREIDGMKINSFIKNLPGTIHKDEYLSFVNLDNIKIINDEIDENSLKMELDKFVNDYPHLYRPKNSVVLPIRSRSPDISNSCSLSYQEWLQLPADEMIKRKKEVDKTTI